MNRSPLKRGGPISRGKLKKFGARAKQWQEFRNAKFERDKDDEGLIRCQDVKIGMLHCGISRDSMDLHHIEGRDGNLLLDETKLVWLTRECHDKAHARIGQ